MANTVQANNGIYWRGDLAIATGKTQVLHGGLFHEYRLVEGHREGDLIVSQLAPMRRAVQQTDGTWAEVAR